jgi:hypothetical protein
MVKRMDVLDLVQQPTTSSKTICGETKWGSFLCLFATPLLKAKFIPISQKYDVGTNYTIGTQLLEIYHVFYVLCVPIVHFDISQNQSFSNRNIVQTWIFLGHPKIKVEALVKTTLTFGLMSFFKKINKFTSFSYSTHLFIPLLWNIPIWSTSFACSTPKLIYLC